MDVAFETERCVVRNWRDSDAERVFDIYSRWEVSRWLGATPRAMERPDEGLRFVERCRTLNDEQPGSGRWAVERKADGVVAGTVILLPLPGGDGELEVGWHLHPDSWGQGLATESARGAVDWGFGRGLEVIYAVVRPDNTASIAVCRRLHMAGLGLTDRYYDATLELFGLTRPRTAG